MSEQNVKNGQSDEQCRDLSLHGSLTQDRNAQKVGTHTLSGHPAIKNVLMCLRFQLAALMKTRLGFFKASVTDVTTDNDNAHTALKI